MVKWEKKWKWKKICLNFILVPGHPVLYMFATRPKKKKYRIEIYVCVPFEYWGSKCYSQWGDTLQKKIIINTVHSLKENERSGGSR